MVVMPSHGQRDIFSFDSVTEKVVKNSTVPVLTVLLKAHGDSD
jgi:nucleotide-binding universal stress UspA family protein